MSRELLSSGHRLAYACRQKLLIHGPEKFLEIERSQIEVGNATREGKAAAFQGETELRAGCDDPILALREEAQEVEGFLAQLHLIEGDQGFLRLNRLMEKELQRLNHFLNGATVLENLGEVLQIGLKIAIGKVLGAEMLASELLQGIGLPHAPRPPNEERVQREDPQPIGAARHLFCVSWRPFFLPTLPHLTMERKKRAHHYTFTQEKV